MASSNGDGGQRLAVVAGRRLGTSASSCLPAQLLHFAPDSVQFVFFLNFIQRHVGHGGAILAAADAQRVGELIAELDLSSLDIGAAHFGESKPGRWLKPGHFIQLEDQFAQCLGSAKHRLVVDMHDQPGVRVIQLEFTMLVPAQLSPELLGLCPERVRAHFALPWTFAGGGQGTVDVHRFGAFDAQAGDGHNMNNQRIARRIHLMMMCPRIYKQNMCV